MSVYRTIGPLVTYAKTKAQISCAVTVQLISAFVFTTGLRPIYVMFFKFLAHLSRRLIGELIKV